MDSVIWIALKHSRDQWHSLALKLRQRIYKAEKIFITDFVMIETYNFLLRKVSSSVAIKTLEMFLNSQKIHILYNDEVSVGAALQLLKKFPHLSLTDANLVWYSKLLNLNEILSFDQGFDRIPSIKRIFE